MDKIGSVINGRYRILEILGQGNMATVYKAYQESLDRDVAIKFMHPTLVNESDFRERFRLEARNVATLQHPHIVQVYDFDSDGDDYYMVMELISGQTLEEKLNDLQTSQELLSWEETLHIIRGLAEALTYAHAHQVIHRDVKPGNIMIDKNGRIILTDFGLAKLATGPQLTQTGLASGTPHYMAPEQILGDSLDYRVDIYALGVLLYRLVTGHLPFTAENAMSVMFLHVSELPPMPRRYTPDIPATLEIAILKALAKRPDDRFSSVNDFLETLETVKFVPGFTSTLSPLPPSSQTYQRIPNNLPASLASFVGREEEVSAITGRILHQDIRLLTLVGPGGTGKTRLSLQVAMYVLREFRDGIFFVDLTSLREPDLLMNIIADTLGVTESSQQTLDKQLQTFLADRQLLLVLDNFEQIVEASPLVAGLLTAVSTLKILVTSREPLRIYGEHLYPVPPLPLPDLHQLPPFKELSQNPSLQLFVTRAQAVNPDFFLTPVNASAVAEICVRLDGLPLAIELIAAQLYHFTIEDLVTQLGHRLDLLIDGPRDRSARQRTMRGAIAWGCELLDASERTAFNQMGVFVGKFTEEATHAVIGPTSLAALVRKNLLQQGQYEEETYFWMLEVIREYALEQLETDQQITHMQQQHAAYYLELVERSEPHLTGPEQGTWFNRLEMTHDNLRAALSWATKQGTIEIALRMTGVLWRLWGVHSHLQEGSQWLERALAQSQNSPSHLRVKSLMGVGRLAFFQNMYAQAVEYFTESLAIYYSLDDKNGQATAYNNLGEIQLEEGNLPEANQFFQKALLLYRQTNHKMGIVRSLSNLGQMAFWQGEYDHSLQLLEECLTLENELGTPEGKAITLNSLGEIHRAKGNYDQAGQFYQASLTLYRQLNYPANVALLLHNLAYVELKQGNDGEAAVLFRKSLDLLKTMEEQRQIAECLAGLGIAILRLGEAEAAVRLFGAAHGLLHRLGSHLDPLDQAEYDRGLIQSQAQLETSNWQLLWDQGQTMPLEDVLEIAFL